MSADRGLPWSLGILAGGRGRRMGRDKALLEIGGRSVLEHQRARLAPDGVPVLVANRPGGPPRPGPWRVVEDPGADLGPLGGLVALLRHAPTPWMLVVPCDQPLLPPDLPEALASAAGPGIEAVGLRVEGCVQPFPVWICIDVLARLEELLDRGERRARAWTQVARVASVVVDERWSPSVVRDALRNANTPSEWRAILERSPG